MTSTEGHPQPHTMHLQINPKDQKDVAPSGIFQYYLKVSTIKFFRGSPVGHLLLHRDWFHYEAMWKNSFITSHRNLADSWGQ